MLLCVTVLNHVAVASSHCDASTDLLHCLLQRPSNPGQDRFLPAAVCCLRCSANHASGASSRVPFRAFPSLEQALATFDLGGRRPLLVFLSPSCDIVQSFTWLSRCCGCCQPPGLPPPTKPNVGRAYLYAALIFVFPLVGAMALVHSNRLAIQVQIKLRAELTSAVYRKALRLSARCGDAALMCPSSCSMCCGIYSVERSTPAAVQDADLARFSLLQGQAADRDWAHCQSDVGGCQQCHGAVL